MKKHDGSGTVKEKYNPNIMQYILFVIYIYTYHRFCRAKRCCIITNNNCVKLPVITTKTMWCGEFSWLDWFQIIFTTDRSHRHVLLSSCRVPHSSVTLFFPRWHMNNNNIFLKKKQVWKQAQTDESTSRCLSSSPGSVNRPQGEDDSRTRWMSRRSKGASPSTSLGNTLTRLPSAPTKPSDSWYKL